MAATMSSTRVAVSSRQGMSPTQARDAGVAWRPSTGPSCERRPLSALRERSFDDRTNVHSKREGEPCAGAGPDHGKVSAVDAVEHLSQQPPQLLSFRGREGQRREQLLRHMRHPLAQRPAFIGQLDQHAALVLRVASTCNQPCRLEPLEQRSQRPRVEAQSLAEARPTDRCLSDGCLSDGCLSDGGSSASQSASRVRYCG